jgi:hypothetical protein
MTTDLIRRLGINLRYVFVATVDSSGQPHVAIGEQVAFSDDCQLIFENWFCPTTLENIACNSRVSVVAVVPDTGKGYQMLGSVIRDSGTAILNACNPIVTTPTPSEALTRFVVKIDKVLEFTGKIHSDIPIAE